MNAPYLNAITELAMMKVRFTTTPIFNRVNYATHQDFEIKKQHTIAMKVCCHGAVVHFYDDQSVKIIRHCQNNIVMDFFEKIQLKAAIL